MRLKLIALVVLFCCVASVVEAQRRNKGYSKQYQDVFPSPPQCKTSGWFFAPGATYTLTRFVKSTETLTETAGSRYDATLKPRGQFGGYLEGGRYHVLPYSKLFKYLDYGIAYKWLRGKENFEGEVINTLDNSVLATTSGTSNYSYHHVTGYFNLNHVWQLSKYNFLQNTIGVNLDYAFINTYKSAQNVAGVSEKIPGQYVAQLHYKLGYGIKANSKLLIIPSIETPILTGWPFDNGRSSTPAFSSRYRPLIVSVRFLFIRDVGDSDCTPIRNVDGWKMPTDMDKQEQLDKK